MNGQGTAASRRLRIGMIVLVCAASLALAVDIWDGQTAKTISSAAILAGVLAWWRARRFHSARWRTAAWAAFGLAVAAFAYRFLSWQGWI